MEQATSLTCADITSEAISQPIHKCADDIDPQQYNLTPNKKETNQLKTSNLTLPLSQANCRTAFSNILLIQYLIQYRLQSFVLMCAMSLRRTIVIVWEWVNENKRLWDGLYLRIAVGSLQCVSWQCRMEVHIPEKQSNIHYIPEAPVMTYFRQSIQRESWVRTTERVHLKGKTPGKHLVVSFWKLFKCVLIGQCSTTHLAMSSATL